MRLVPLLLAVVAVIGGCQDATGLLPGQVSCQPAGMEPAPVAFVFAPGPATAASAQETGVAMIEACAAEAWKSGVVDPAGLTSTVEAGMGDLTGPNKGREVWLVRIDVPAGDGIEYHYLVEVRRDTGVPTLIGIG